MRGCCLTFSSKQGGKEKAFPQRTEEDKQMKLFMLTEVKT